MPLFNKTHDFFIIPFVVLSLEASIHHQETTIIALSFNPKLQNSQQIIKIESTGNYRNMAANSTWHALYDLQIEAKSLVQPHW